MEIVVLGKTRNPLVRETGSRVVFTWWNWMSMALDFSSPPGKPPFSREVKRGIEQEERTSNGIATSMVWYSIIRMPNWMGAILLDFGEGMLDLRCELSFLAVVENWRRGLLMDDECRIGISFSAYTFPSS